MFLKNPFYESANFVVRLPDTQISKVRKDLIKCLNIRQTKDYYKTDIHIQIDNPRMYHQSRRIGFIHRPKFSLGNLELKSITRASASPSHPSPSIITPRLNKVSISKRKLKKIQINTKTFHTSTQNSIVAIEELVIPEQFRKKDKSKERKQKVKKAAKYLMKMGNELKNYLKREDPPKRHTPKTEGIYRRINIIEHKEENKLIKYDSQDKMNKTSNNDWNKSYDNIMETQHDEKKSVMNYLMKITGEDIVFSNKSKEKHVIECKKEVKKKKKRYHTVTSLCSGLSLEEKLEQLAIGRLVN